MKYLCISNDHLEQKKFLTRLSENVFLTENEYFSEQFSGTTGGCQVKMYLKLKRGSKKTAARSPGY
jgi:hypothetical protein